MDNLNSIIMLLQLVLGLLSSNPSPANQALAVQAVNLATASLAVQTESIVPPSPDFSPETGTGGPTQVILSPQAIPNVNVTNGTSGAVNPESCTLSASVSNIEYIWNWPATSTQPNTEFFWHLSGLPNTTKGQVLTPSNIGSLQQLWPEQPNSVPDGGHVYVLGYFPGQITVQFGDATCTTYFPTTPWTSTSTPGPILNSTPNPQ